MNRNIRTGRLAGMALLAAALVLGSFLIYWNASVKNGVSESSPPSFREGDIIFQVTISPQSEALQFATGSKYTHCGILLEHNKKMHVFEAIRTVSWTPLEEWIARGVDGHYVLMRIKDPALRPDAATLAAMKKAGLPMAGKPYDLLFQWSDDKIYCSELVWKMYERGAGIALSEPHTFREYHLDNPLVRAIIEERYGHGINLDERAVAPSDLMESELLETVGGN